MAFGLFLDLRYVRAAKRVSNALHIRYNIMPYVHEESGPSGLYIYPDYP